MFRKCFLLSVLFSLTIASVSHADDSRLLTESSELLIQEVKQEPSLNSKLESLEIIVPKEKQSNLFLDSVQKMADHLPPKIDNLFRKLKVSDEIREFVLADFKKNLEKSPLVISQSNANGNTLQALTIVGFGLSDLIMNAMKASRVGFMIPRNGKFGLVLGVGATLLRVQQPDGKMKLILRFHASYEKLDRVINWMAEAFAGVALSKMSAQISERMKVFEKVTFPVTNYGIAGRMTVADHHFEHSISGGLGATAPFSTTFIYVTEAHQYQINFFLSDWHSRFKKSCQSFLSRAN